MIIISIFIELQPPCMPTVGYRGTGEVLVRRSGDNY